jgi:hypothetical protein
MPQGDDDVLTHEPVHQGVGSGEFWSECDDSQVGKRVGVKSTDFSVARKAKPSRLMRTVFLVVEHRAL